MLAGEMSEAQQQTSAMCGQSGMEGAATKRGTAARRHDAIMYASAAGHRAMAELQDTPSRLNAPPPPELRPALDLQRDFCELEIPPAAAHDITRRRASAPHSRSACSSDAQTAVDGARWDTWSTLLVVQTLVQSSTGWAGSPNHSVVSLAGFRMLGFVGARG